MVNRPRPRPDDGRPEPDAICEVCGKVAGRAHTHHADLGDD